MKDVIGDLPSLRNGASESPIERSQPPISAFQREIRGRADGLLDHVCKPLSILNLKRCSCIPPEQNHDWRYLRVLVESGQEPERHKWTENGKEKDDLLVPWCLPNTEAKHNGWRGLFSRLDLQGHFPTSVTDPNPMGKVGQVFHPKDHRIVSVRECARSQGFPDHFQFYGPIGSRHRQVGNAVPPPLARALGTMFRAALDRKAAAMEE